MKVTHVFRSVFAHLAALRFSHKFRSRTLKQSSAIGAIWLALIGSLVFSECANATVWVYVSDVSQLQYSTNGNFLYFRNFNQFNASALGCCWNYWIDTTTTEGKNTFALIMAAAAQAKPMYFGVPDGYASGLVALNGIF
jgi:hypothetical protein